jgi:hypothetical protein
MGSAETAGDGQIAEHTDTVATGPTTAADLLKKLGD